MTIASPTTGLELIEAASGCGQSRCLLDSPESHALLARHNIRLSQAQIKVFRDIETRWKVNVFNMDTAGCLINGRFDQQAVDGYFIAVERIWRLGADATVESIVQELATLSENGVAFVLFSAAYCMLFSDAIAHEAYRQLMSSKADKRRRAARAGIRAYRDLVGLAETALRRAASAG